MVSKIDLSLIILSFNTRQLLEKCLKSVVRHTSGINYEIIVVDNGSTDGSVNLIKNLKLKIKNLVLVENRQNLGFSQGNNQGMKRASGRYFLLLNSDCWFLENTGQKIVDFLDQRPEVDLVGSRVLHPDGSFQASAGHFPSLPRVLGMLFGEKFFPGWGLKHSPVKEKEVDWVSGAVMALRPKVFQKTGGFDEKMFMYMEEVEWCWRINKNGGRIFFWPGTKVVHLGGGSSVGKSEPIVKIFQGLVYFYQKHCPAKVGPLRVLLAAKALVSLALGKPYLPALKIALR